MKTKKKCLTILLTCCLFATALICYVQAMADDYYGGDTNIFCRGQMSKMCKMERGNGCGFSIPGSKGNIICKFPTYQQDNHQVIQDQETKDPVPSN